MQMEGTVFTPSLEGMKHVKSESGVILTKPFLQVCKQILPVLGNINEKKETFCMSITFMWFEKWDPDFWIIVSEKFGSAMSIVKTDIGGNITARRIRSRCKFHIMHLIGCYCSL
jgi:hypothetical protein